MTMTAFTGKLSLMAFRWAAVAIMKAVKFNLNVPVVIVIVTSHGHETRIYM